jgi:hypothetical protein
MGLVILNNESVLLYPKIEKVNHTVKLYAGLERERVGNIDESQDEHPPFCFDLLDNWDQRLFIMGVLSKKGIVSMRCCGLWMGPFVDKYFTTRDSSRDCTKIPES